MKIAEKVGGFITRRYKTIIVFSMIFTVAMFYFMSKLTLNMQFMDILPETEPAVIAYKEARNNFDSLDNIIVGVEGKKKDIELFIDANAEELYKIDNIKSVEYEWEEEFLRKFALLLYKEKDLENLGKSLKANSLVEFLAGINDNFEKTYISGGDTEKIDKDKTSIIYFLNLIEEILIKMKTGELSYKEAEKFLFGEKYFISGDESLGIITIKSIVSINDMPGIIKSVNEIEDFLKSKAEKYNVAISLTGTHVIARDEMVVSEKDATLTSALSMILIFILFILAFRLLRYSLLVLVPLICGVIWSMGITYLIIGSLNMITAMMGAILIGLGIDYSIHIISYFLEEREKGVAVETAVILLFQKVMKGVVAGAITTAIGFLMFSFSDFPGFSEFGIVLGLGIICALTSAIFVLPSLLLVFGKKELKQKKLKFSVFSKIESLVIKQNKKMLVFILLVFAFFGYQATKIEFETDMMKIEPEGLASVELNRKIIDKFDFSSDNTLLVSDSLEESQELYYQADKLKTVGQISSIASYLPSIEKQNKRLEIIDKLKLKTVVKLSNVLDEELLSEELFRLESNIIELSDLGYIGGEIDLQERCDEIIEAGIIAELAESIDKYRDNIINSQKYFISGLRNLITKMKFSNFGIEDLPEKIISNYLGGDNKYLTIILPKGDLWESNFQKSHMKELNTLSKDITGSSVIFLKVVEAEIREGKKVITLTIFAIFFILLIDLKSLKYALLSILPMILTVIVALGIMATIGLKLDVVNVIGLPLIIGIGVDDGVHIIHRYLRENNLQTALASTGRAITLTTLTTIAAFGTLVLAEYRGFVNFGKLLFLGVGGAYVVTILFLVGLVAWVDKVDLKKK